MNYLPPLVNSNLDPRYFEYNTPEEPTNRRTKEYENQRNDLTKKTTVKQDTVYNETFSSKSYISVLEGIQEKNQMNIAYFSQQNINFVQKCLRYDVYTKSNSQYIIDKQSETDLVLVMRAVYFEHSRYNPDPEEIKKEISRLDKIAVDRLTPKVMSEIEQYVHYLKDASSTYKPMAAPESTNSYGTKVMRSVSDVLNVNGDRLN